MISNSKLTILGILCLLLASCKKEPKRAPDPSLSELRANLTRAALVNLVYRAESGSLVQNPVGEHRELAQPTASASEPTAPNTPPPSPRGSELAQSIASTSDPTAPNTFPPEPRGSELAQSTVSAPDPTAPIQETFDGLGRQAPPSPVLAEPRGSEFVTGLGATATAGTTEELLPSTTDLQQSPGIADEPEQRAGAESTAPSVVDESGKSPGEGGSELARQGSSSATVAADPPDAPDPLRVSKDRAPVGNSKAVSASRASAAEQELAAKKGELAMQQAVRHAMASLFGAGQGFTGASAGSWGDTGIGAGSGHTGIGAGRGHTGMGAGTGNTGVGAGHGHTGVSAGDGATGIGAGKAGFTGTSASSHSAAGADASISEDGLVSGAADQAVAIWWTAWGPVWIPVVVPASTQ